MPDLSSYKTHTFILHARYLEKRHILRYWKFGKCCCVFVVVRKFIKLDSVQLLYCWGNKCQLSWSTSSIYFFVTQTSSFKNVLKFLQHELHMIKPPRLVFFAVIWARATYTYYVCMCDGFCEISQVKFDGIGDKEKSVLILTIWLVVLTCILSGRSLWLNHW